MWRLFHLIWIITSRGPETQTIHQADVVLLEGILVLYDVHVRDLMHMKLFVDTDSDTRLARRGYWISFSYYSYNTTFMCL